MAARKAETETPGGNVPEARAKSAVVEIDSKSKGTSFNPSYEAITQEISYLMSIITNQNNQGITMGIWFVGDVEVLDIGGVNVQHLDKTIISLLNQKCPALSPHQPGGHHYQTTEGRLGCLWNWGITILIPGLEYGVEQRNLKLKLIGGKGNIIEQPLGKLPVF